MALPKKIKYDIDINPPNIGTKKYKYGDERIKKLLNDTDPRTKYLPQTILFEDLDEVIFNLVENGELSLVLDKNKVPTIFMDNSRWGEFSKTWKIADDDKNVKTPYITVRRTAKDQGTRLGNKTQIPQQRRFSYVNVPIEDNGEQIYLSFKLPEPVNVDLTYDIQLFTKYRVDVNKYDELFFKKFSSIQLYVFPKGNPMPVTLVASDEPRDVQNIDGDKFYISNFTILLKGFIQNENDIEVVKTTRKPIIGYFLS
ncbi:MAG: hypothetical protein ACOCVF_00635 [bacterium]